MVSSPQNDSPTQPTLETPTPPLNAVSICTPPSPVIACTKEHHPCYLAASCSLWAACRRLASVINVRACSRKRDLSCTYLSLLRPSTDDIIVLARMPCAEVGKGARVLLVVPDLAHQPRVDVAHENLADGVDAVSWAAWVSKCQGYSRDRGGHVLMCSSRIFPPFLKDWVPWSL